MNKEQILNECDIIQSKGLKDIILIGVYSPINESHEYTARDMIKQRLGESVNVVCSRDVGQVGFLERENAAILNG